MAKIQGTLCLEKLTVQEDSRFSFLGQSRLLFSLQKKITAKDQKQNTHAQA